MDPCQQCHLTQVLRADEAPDILVAEAASEDTNMQRSALSRHFWRVLSDRFRVPVPNVLLDADGRVWTRIGAAELSEKYGVHFLPAGVCEQALRGNPDRLL